MKGFTTRQSKNSIPIHLVGEKELKKWLAKQSKAAAAWLKNNSFRASASQVVRVPASDGSVAFVALGTGTDFDMWSLAAAAKRLPAGKYHLASKLKKKRSVAACVAWALAHYSFRKYKSAPASKGPELLWPPAADRAEVQRLVDGTELARDLVNMPAEDMGPAELAKAASALAKKHKARFKVTVGKALLDNGFPAIHAVGRAATKIRAPRLIDIRWGKTKDPKLTLVGKGVVFDSGGLDIKPAAGMRWMKKDMGGAASVLALAHMIMDAKLPVRLRVLVPAVENAVSADSFRPGDVLNSRSGKTIEVGNTDAEGRLILADALTEASSEKPDLLIDFATLTGAARVALGTELPALFCNDDEVAESMLAACDSYDEDPLWRMPLFEPYRRHLRSYIADVHNISSTRTGGAITAALFLSEFAGSCPRWIHIDTMAWNLGSRPGRPEGGEAFGVRTAFRMLKRRYAR